METSTKHNSLNIKTAEPGAVGHCITAQDCIAAQENIYRKVSNIRRTKSLNLNASCLILKLSLPIPLKPGVKLRTKM